MTLVFQHPANVDSRLARWDARWKTAALLPAAGIVAALATCQAAAVALLGSWLLLARAGLAARWYCARLGTVLLFLALFVVFVPLAVRPDEVPWYLGPVPLSPAGLTLALLVLLKGMAVVTLLMTWWATAPVETHLKALHSLRVPGLVVQLLLMTHRYLHLLIEEYRRLRIALRLRGYRQRANLHTYRTVGHVTGTLLVRSYDRAERVGQALRCRGFNGRFRSLTDFQATAYDVLVFGVVMASALGILAWDLAQR
jgi:cobalt/nickel transport system permease protein